MKGIATAVLIAALAVLYGVMASTPPLSSTNIQCLIRNKQVAKALAAEGQEA
jgi:hypothetical protein